MVHAVSATYLRFEHMSPAAVGLAVLLHASVAWALWWATPLKSHDAEESAIEVTMERPEAALPAPAPLPTPRAAPEPQVAVAPPPPSPPPTPPSGMRTPLGLRAPAAETAEKSQDMQDHPRPAEIEEKQQQREPSRQEALAAPSSPPPEPKIEPKPEQALPPVEPPPAPPRAQELAAVAPKPPPHPPQPPPPKPQQARPPTANSALRPSPLSEHSRPSPDPRAAAAPSATFVNPADQAHRTRVTDQYVWQVVRKMSQYLPDLRVKGQVGTVVLRLVIDRSGRLIDASVAQSSGHTVLDKALLETIRAAAPYSPLPPELPGDRVTLSVPVGSAYR